MKSHLLIHTCVLTIATTFSHAAQTGFWDFEEGTSATMTTATPPGTVSEAFPTGISIGAGGVNGSSFSLENTGVNGAFLDTNVTGSTLGITGTGAKTLISWIKSDSSGAWDDGSKYGILSYSPTNGGIAGQGLRMLIDEDAGGFRFEVNSGFIATSSNLDDGNWHMLAVVINADDEVGQAQLYVDGAFQTITSSGTPTRDIDTSASAGAGILDLVIGGTHNTVDSGTDALQGSIDGVRIYDEALNLGALNAIYTAVPEPKAYGVILGLACLMPTMLRRRQRG